MEKPTSNQVPNPTGKGGFGDNPQNRSNGRWSKENSFSYWLNYFKSLTVPEFRDYETNKPEEERTVAESLAYARISKARADLSEFKEVADRTEGKAMQSIDMTTGGDKINIALVEFIGDDTDDQDES